MEFFLLARVSEWYWIVVHTHTQAHICIFIVCMMMEKNLMNGWMSKVFFLLLLYWHAWHYNTDGRNNCVLVLFNKFLGLGLESHLMMWWKKGKMLKHKNKLTLSTSHFIFRCNYTMHSCCSSMRLFITHSCFVYAIYWMNVLVRRLHTILIIFPPAVIYGLDIWINVEA